MCGFALCAVASSRPRQTTSERALIGAVFVTDVGIVSGEVKVG